MSDPRLASLPASRPAGGRGFRRGFHRLFRDIAFVLPWASGTGLALCLLCSPLPAVAGAGAGLPGTAALAVSGSGTAAFGSASPGGDSVKVWIDLRDKGPGRGGGACSAGPGPCRAYEDKPVHRPYLDSLAAAGARVLVALKWQNRVSARVPASRLARLRALPWVAGVHPVPRKAPKPPLPPWAPWLPGGAAAKRSGRAGGGLAYGAARALMDSLRISDVHGWMARKGMAPGRGVRVAVIDADFHLGHRAFRPLLDRGGVKDTWDFVDGDPLGADSGLADSHGAECLSLIAASLPDTLVGAAPEAEFLLYRAEDDSQERYVEEDFVAAAIERAVDSGAQVISISLGYRDAFTDGSPDYPHAWLDGRTRPSSLAALGAARRNVVVVASIGNASPEAAAAAPSLGAPADADSILAVGIVDKDRLRCGYSCIGPTADGRIKPDIASLGPEAGCRVPVARAATHAAVHIGAGTSYAAPVIAGLAALLRQARPALGAEAVRQAILSSGHRAARPDTLVGYGLADAWEALHGPGAVPPPSGGRIARVFHAGGSAPLSVAWVTEGGAREALVVDARGRRIPVTARVSGARILLQPERDLGAGVYFVRVRPPR